MFVTKKMRDLMIAYKLGLGFGFLALIMIAILGVNLWHGQEIAKLNYRTTHLRVPTVNASSHALEALQKALASLRGGVLIDDESFRGQRLEAWEEIHAAFKKLNDFSQNWTNPANIVRLKKINNLLSSFEQEQAKIEIIAHKSENIPALKLFLDQANPLARIMAENITAMINAEKGLPAGMERKSLLSEMADVRGSFGLSLASLRTFLLLGKEVDWKEFQQLWQKNQTGFQQLSHDLSRLTAEQENFFHLFKEAREKFVPITSRLHQLRISEQANLAVYWLKTKAAPLGGQISNMLGAMVKNQQELLQEDAREVEQRTDNLVQINWTAGIISLLLAGLLSFFITRSITFPLSKVVSFAQEITKGNLMADLLLVRKDEIGILACNLVEMRNHLSQTVEKVIEQSVDVSAHATTLSLITKQINKQSGAVETETSQSALAAESMSQGMFTITESTEHMSRGMQEVAAFAKQASENMQTISAASEQANTNLAAVAASTEQANVSMVSVNEGAQRMVDNVSIVTAAVEQMNASLGEVRNRCNEATQNSDKATGLTTGSQQAMQQLNASAQEIGQVIDLIKNIANQVDMLALNAAIEAARAGESGKGFVVVAKEVKALAGRTTEATRNIAEQVKGIQSNTEVADVAMKSVFDIVAELAQGNEEINHAITEQSAALAEITQSMSSVNAETIEVTRRVSEATEGIAEVTRNANEISAGMDEVTRNVGQTAQGIEQMSVQVMDASDSSVKIARQVTEAKQEANQVSASMQIINIATQTTSGLGILVNDSSQDLGRASGTLESVIKFFQLTIPEKSKVKVDETYRWGQEFLTGIPEIDGQHLRLFALSAQLKRAIQRGNDDLLPLITALGEYAGTHLGFEEKLFDTCSWPDRDDHEKIHTKLRKDLKSFVNRLDKGGNQQQLGKDLAEFVRNWLLKHILY